jgi:hypothetical protein
MSEHASTGVLRRYARLARKQGWKIEPARGGGHAGIESWYAPNGAYVMTTNGKTKAAGAVISKLTKAGLRLDDRHAKR